MVSVLDMQLAAHLKAADIIHGLYAVPISFLSLILSFLFVSLKKKNQLLSCLEM